MIIRKADPSSTGIYAIRRFPPERPQALRQSPRC